MITKFIGIEVLKNIKINLGSVALFVQLWSELLLLPQSLSVAMEMLIMLRHPVTGLYKWPPHHRKFIPQKYLMVSVKPILTILCTAEYCSVNKDAASV